MSSTLEEGPASSWWPGGPFTDALADAVLASDWAEAKRLSEEFKQIVAERADYDMLVDRVCKKVEACDWIAADETLELMERFPDMVKFDLSYYQTIVAFERDATVLDRIVEATDG